LSASLRQLVSIALHIIFRKFEDKRVTVTALASDPEGIEITESGPKRVEARILHSENAPNFSALALEFCTVTCLVTGESRSGRNVCIDCVSNFLVVKICC